ncbi:aldo/keto reductase [Mucilaginibacter sp. cycad4]|uniref:aldo/keto reductase n=1 Tax=Mucilaginibacter sp. cycad4 TaxID=3342096 RepID=UPI002AABC3D0|nr:aldo/keto reductase [Mucilaginibacter gossypii]WPV02113.1 aldo/keto reductase [Mucilaginibacter gossypii]
MEKDKATLTFKIGGTLEINRLGYGAMQLTGKGVFGDIEDRESAKEVLRQAIALGVNFIDTAEAYGPATNEILIAEALHPYEAGVIIATKGGFRRPGPAEWIPNGDPGFIRENIEDSLKRLKVETIDLWQLHRVDPEVPLEKTLEPVAAAVKAGKIRYVGLSEVTVAQIEQAREILPIVSVQNLYNLSDRKWEDVLDYTAANDLAFIPWFPLASGPAAMADKLADIARKHNATVAQVALSWLLKRSPNILLIPGTKSVAHLEENMQATKVNLSEEDFEILSKQ